MLFPVSVIIVNWNSLLLLKKCLENLFTISDLYQMKFGDIIIVDNGSVDGSKQWLRRLSDERVKCIFSPENIGFAAGNNIGIQYAKEKFILLLNTDAFPGHDALGKMVSYLDCNPEVGVVGPQLVYPDDRWQRSVGRAPSPWSAFLDACGFTSVERTLLALLWPYTGRWWRPREVEYVDGACMLIRREVLEQVGGLDERFFFFVEDAEYCVRVRKHGWKVIHFPASRVLHLRGGSSSQKNFERTVKQKVRSEMVFLLAEQSENAWRRLVFWRQINFWWRMQLAKCSGNKERYQYYRASYLAYGEAGL